MKFFYDSKGGMTYRTIRNATTTFSYTGNLMKTAAGGEAFSLDYDLNGNLTSNESQATNYEYNWNNKLRSAQKGTTTMSVKYDPSGNRIWKQSVVGGNTTTRKYIVDVVGDLPVLLYQVW